MKWRPYPVYREAGASWLGAIPSEWRVERLKYAAPAFNEKVDARGVAFQYLGMENIESGTGRYVEGQETIESDGLANHYHAGNVLLGKLRPYLAKALLAPSEGICSSELLVLRAHSVLPKNLFYYVLSDGFIKEVDSSTYGSKMPRASWDFIGNLPVVISSPDEQSSISTFLDRETAKLDTLIAKQERLIALLQEKRQAVISHAVTKGLDSNTPMKDSGVEWLGAVPEHWQVKQFGMLLERITYGFTNPMPETDDGPFMLTANDIGDGEIKYATARHTSAAAFEKSITDKSRPRAGDLLLTKDGTLGRVAIAGEASICINQSVALLRPRQPKLQSTYGAFALRGGVYQDRMVLDAGGTTIKHIYITRLAKMAFAVPPIQEQAAISLYLTDQLTKLNVLIGKATRSIALMREHRVALIAAAVTGKIDVREN